MLIPPLAMLFVGLLQPPQQAPAILFRNEYASDPTAVLRPTKSVEAVPAKSSLEGTWYRDGVGMRQLVTFKGNRFISEIQGYNVADGELVKATIEADFTLNSENVVYGVVTGVDCNQPEEKLDWVTEMPFSFRVRRDGNSLSIRELKAAMPKDAQAPWPTGDLATKYTLVDEKNPLPALKKQAAQVQQYREDPNMRLQQLRGQADELRQVGEEYRKFWSNEQPSHRNPEREPIQGATLAAPVQAPQVVASQQHPGSVLPVPQTATPAAKPTLHGTWIRYYQGVQLVLRINPDSVTVTATTVIGVAPEQVKITQFLAADSAIGKDGITLFGVMTGVDAQIEGGLPEMKLPEAGTECEKKMQAMIGEPLLMTLRVYNNQLLVSKVRVGNTGGPDNISDALNKGLSGRYEFLGDKPVPAPKPMTQDAFQHVPSNDPSLPPPLPPTATNGQRLPPPLPPTPQTQSPPQPEASCEKPEPARPETPVGGPQVSSKLPPVPAQQATPAVGTIAPVPEGMAYVYDPVTKKVELQAFQRAPHSAPSAVPLQPSSYEIYDRKLGTMVRVTDLPATASRGAQLPSAMTPQPLPPVPQALQKKITAEAFEGFSTLGKWVFLKLARATMWISQFGIGFQTYQKGYTLPSPHYLQHPPQYFPADPQFPLPRERAMMEQAPLPRPVKTRAGWEPGLERFLDAGRGKFTDASLFPQKK